MSWAIVHFTKENSVEAVPVTWFIESSKECFWPPQNYRREHILRLIQERASPQCDWKIYSAVSLGCYDDFATAERKANRAMNSNDLSSANDTAFGNSNTRKSRKRKKNPKYHQSDSSSQDSPDISDDDHNSYPSFRKKVLASSASHGLKIRKQPSLLSNFGTSKGRAETTSMVKENCAPTVSFEELDLCGSRSQPDETEFSSSTPTRATKESNNSCPDIGTILSTRRTNILPNDDDFKKFVIDNLTELNFKSNAIMESLKTLVASRELQSTTHLAVFENNAKTFYEKIPIQNELELADFEDWLKNDSNYGLVLSELTRLGGKSLGQNVRRILYRLLTDEVALMYSWDGAKEKKSFKNLRLAKVILDSMKFQYKTAIETEIIGVIKYWLVKAKERIKNKQKGKGQENEALNEEN